MRVALGGLNDREGAAAMFEGLWRCRVHAPVGAQDVVLWIEKKAGKLVGEARGAEVVPMLDPQVRDGCLTWTQKVSVPMRLTIAFSVRIEEGRLVGIAKAGLFPRVKVDGVRIARDEHEPGAIEAGVEHDVALGAPVAARTRWPALSVDTSTMGERPVVGMFMFPGMTALDMVGPHAVLSGPTRVLLIARDDEPVVCDTGLVIRPDVAMHDVPERIDVLFVPGGPGQVGVMADDDVLRFLADRGRRAGRVTSACTGSLILGAAGLMAGYKATTHWAALDLLRAFGAEPVDARIVVDRDRITGGGVTAGIDFGLVLLRELFDDRVARTTQLLMEYAPEPPFDAGRPDQAGEEIVAEALRIMEPAAREVTAMLARRPAAA